jgi:hypothetical protein
MEADPLHCLAVHCRGGKGRTGVMIAAWLLYTGFCRSAAEALAFFADARTGRAARAAQGVSQPSQQRYVGYAQRAVAAAGFHSPPAVLRRIVVRAPPRRGGGGAGLRPWFTIEENGHAVFDLRRERPACLTEPPARGPEGELSFDVGMSLQGDVRVVFFDHDDPAAPPDTPATNGGGGAAGGGGCAAGAGLVRPRRCGAADDLCFFLWVHTGFLFDSDGRTGGGDRVVRLAKAEVDVACHDRECKV